VKIELNTENGDSGKVDLRRLPSTDAVSLLNNGCTAMTRGTASVLPEIHTKLDYEKVVNYLYTRDLIKLKVNVH